MNQMIKVTNKMFQMIQNILIKKTKYKRGKRKEKRGGERFQFFGKLSEFFIRSVIYRIFRFMKQTNNQWLIIKQL